LSVEPLDDRIVPARLSVADATVVEGNAGTQYAQVTVRLDTPSWRTVTVNYATAGASATPGSDFTAASGQLTFTPGQTVKSVLVPLHGDRTHEPNETFAVVLSGARNASIRDGTGVVTITDDEPRVRVGDTQGTVVYHLDGSVSGATLHFTVSLAMAYDEPVTVNYATADGTATAGVDYLAVAGTLTFAAGETTKTIAVTTTANFAGVTRWFSVNLSSASANAQILDGQGGGTIHFYVEQPSGGGGGCDPDNPYWPNC